MQIIPAVLYAVPFDHLFIENLEKVLTLKMPLFNCSNKFTWNKQFRHLCNFNFNFKDLLSNIGHRPHIHINTHNTKYTYRVV